MNHQQSRFSGSCVSRQVRLETESTFQVRDRQKLLGFSAGTDRCVFAGAAEQLQCLILTPDLKTFPTRTPDTPL